MRSVKAKSPNQMHNGMRVTLVELSTNLSATLQLVIRNTAFMDLHTANPKLDITQGPFNSAIFGDSLAKSILRKGRLWMARQLNDRQALISLQQSL